MTLNGSRFARLHNSIQYFDSVSSSTSARYCILLNELAGMNAVGDELRSVLDCPALAADGEAER